MQNVSWPVEFVARNKQLLNAYVLCSHVIGINVADIAIRLHRNTLPTERTFPGLINLNSRLWRLEQVSFRLIYRQLTQSHKKSENLETRTGRDTGPDYKLFNLLRDEK